MIVKFSSSSSNCTGTYEIMSSNCNGSYEFAYRAVFTYSVMLYANNWLDLIEVFRRVVYEVPGPRPKLALGSPDPAEPETERMRPAPARQ